jgi:ion channel POLLUX/CASTOR
VKNNRIEAIRNRLRYEFDKNISKGPLVLGAWVALASLAIILLLTVGVYLAHFYTNMGFMEIFWTMLLQALAPNPVDVNAGPWPFLLAMLLITLLGLFMVSVFIGIISTSIEAKVNSCARGARRSSRKTTPSFWGGMSTFLRSSMN